MKHFACLIFVAATAFAADDPWRDWQFLIGNWEAVNQPAGAKGAFVFEIALDGRVLIRRNHSESAALRHDDLMVIYRQGSTVRADYYDTEGHVIRYRALVVPERIVFVSDRVKNVPRYRVTYTPRGERKVHGLFEIAPVNSDKFKKYLEWEAVRR